MKDVDRSFVRGTKFGELYDLLEHKTPPQQIERLEILSPYDFKRLFARHSLPVIFKSLSSPCEGLLEHVRQNCGHTIVKVRYGDYADPESYPLSKRKLKEISISGYIATLTQQAQQSLPPYAGNFPLPASFLTTLGAGVPPYYPADKFEPPTVWLGAAGCVTPLHRDSTDNFAIHLLGTKRWTIFPPQDAPYLYMTTSGPPKRDFATSAVDLRDPDHEAYPLFKNAKAITFEVNAGETLYLPMGWAHYVENVSLSLMVNYWLSSGIAALADP
jgi:hypothetical protein